MRRFAVAIVMLLAACGAAGPVCETSVIVETEQQSCIGGAGCIEGDRTPGERALFGNDSYREVDYTYAVTICTHPDGTVTSSKEMVP